MRFWILQALILFSSYGSAYTEPPQRNPKPIFTRKDSSPTNEMGVSKKDISVTAEAQPLTFVNHVNTIYGNLLIPTLDLSFDGPLPLSLVRYYNSKSTGYTWMFGMGMTSNYAQVIAGLPVSDRAYDIMVEEKNFIPQIHKKNKAALYHKGKKSAEHKTHPFEYKTNASDAFVYAAADEEGGSLIQYSAKPHLKNMTYYIDPDTIHKGLTNTGCGEISARTNLKNTKIHSKGHWQTIHGEEYLTIKWFMTTCDGTEREYFKTPEFEDSVYIRQERKPSGNKLMFDYKKNDFFGYALGEIKATNYCHQHTFGKLKIDCDTDHEKVVVESTNGKKVTYKLKGVNKDRLKNPRIEEIISSDHPHQRYYYTHGEKAPYLLSYIGYPDGRYLKIYYDKKDRVIEQKGPVGPNDSEETLFRFNYNRADRETEVFDANGYKSLYKYSKRKRLKSIARYNHKEEVLREEKFFWGEREHIHRGERDDSDEGHLLAKAIVQDGAAVSHTKYKYDNHGNIIQEKISGNLTGQGEKTFPLTDEGKLKNKVESYKKYADYYHDQYHMIKEQREEDGPTFSYEYKKDSNLLEAKFTKEGQKIRIREFFEYDSDAILIKKIIDDGSSPEKENFADVTERHSTYITPVREKEGFGVGQPSEIDEYYFDVRLGRETRLKRTTYEYNKAGRVIEETAYDASNKDQFHMYYSYDDFGNLTRKKHSAGKEYVFEYDENCNKIREELIGSRTHKEFLYDKANRVIKEISFHEEGQPLVTCFTYDNASNKIAITDPMGQVTRFKYDALHRVKTIYYPAVVDITGATMYPKEHKEYDSLNNIISITDGNNHKTTYEYTIRGQPYLITHPDGSTEKSLYNKNGTLAKKWDPQGTLTEYTYDYLRRPTKITVAGEKVTTHTYSAFHETSSTDPMGMVTEYQYDGAGRLIIEKKQDKKVQFDYDSLGRKYCTKIFAQDNSWIATYISYDTYDRIIEEKSVYSDGTLLSLKKYSYDLLDHCIETRTYTSPKICHTDQIEYNSLGLPARHIDPTQAITNFTYDYTWKNELDQTVLRKETIDPLGNKTCEIFNAFSRLDTVERRSADNILLSKTVYRYDAKGNKAEERHSIYTDGVFIRDYTIGWTYTSTDLIATCSEQQNLPEEKKTKYTYLPGGLIETITKPNAICLTHTYDAFSRLKTLQASDNSIDYSYTYDLNNNILAVTDAKLNLTYKKSYDIHNRIIEDCMGTGLTSHFSHDTFDRVTNVSFSPDKTINYRYKSGRLFEISRKDASSKNLYVHRYDSFDLVGHVTKSTLIKACGTVSYTWDELDRLQSLSSPLFTENDLSYNAVGNLLEYKTQDPEGEVSYSFTYDDLYQLAQEHGTIDASYKNDSLHNRLEKDETPYEINPLNELLSSPGTTFTYDKNGNPIELHRAGRSLYLSYDALDRLIAVEEPLLSRVEYGYDAAHRRIFKKLFSWDTSSWHNDNTVNFLFFNKREVGAIDQNGTIDEFRVLGLGKGAELGASIALELNGELSCPLHDHRGNICLLINPTTKATTTYRYSAFGEEQIFGSSSNPWRFASKRVDPETNFIFFGQRYYFPQVGRFLTSDPLGFSAGPNLYAYVKNSPLSLIDPYGLLDEKPEEQVHSSLFYDGYVRSCNLEYYSEEMLYLHFPNHKEDTPFNAVCDKIFPSHITALSHNEPSLTGEYSLNTSRLGWLINGENFAETYKGKNLGASIGVFFCGIQNSYEEAKASAQLIFDASNGKAKDILICYNPADSLRMDLMECGIQKSGFSSYPVQQLQKSFVSELDKCKQNNISFKCAIFAHSQGALTARDVLNAPEFSKGGSLRHYIGKQATFGAPIQPAGAYNYAARGDIVPYFAILDRLNQRQSTISCGKFSDPFTAHSFSGPSYQEALKDSIDNKGMFNE